MNPTGWTEEVMKRLGLRVLLRGDLPRVMEIESLCFSPAWTEEEMRGVLSCANTRGRVATVVHESRELVVGYLIYAWGDGRTDIVALAVHPGWQRLGVGSFLVESLKRRLNRTRPLLVASAPESSLPVQQFLQACGFFAPTERKEDGTYSCPKFAGEHDAQIEMHFHQQPGCAVIERLLAGDVRATGDEECTG